MDRKEREYRLQSFLERIKKYNTTDRELEAFASMKKIEEVDVENAFSGVSNKIHKRDSKIRFLRQIQRIAAVLFIPVLLTSIFLISRNWENLSTTVQQTIVNPTGVRSQIELPDGSIVWLNSDTKISYSKPFASNKRIVELSGEAYFDVESNPENPFYVNTGKVTVRVTGTKFNVKSYSDESLVNVSLEEGKIYLITESGRKKHSTQMIPGMRAVYNTRSGKTSFSKEDDIHKYSAWQKGKLVFDDTPFPQVIKTLERWYSVNIDIMSNEIEKYKLTTSFQDQTIDQVIKLLELSSPISIDYYPLELNGEGHIKEKPQIKIRSKISDNG